MTNGQSVKKKQTVNKKQKLTIIICASCDNPTPCGRLIVQHGRGFVAMSVEPSGGLRQLIENLRHQRAARFEYAACLIVLRMRRIVDEQHNRQIGKLLERG